MVPARRNLEVKCRKFPCFCSHLPFQSLPLLSGKTSSPLSSLPIGDSAAALSAAAARRELLPPGAAFKCQSLADVFLSDGAAAAAESSAC